MNDLSRLLLNSFKVQGDSCKYHDYSPYLSMRKIHVDAKVDEQTMLFFYIQAFLLPEDEVTEDFESFFISHPF